jgi:phage terminase large subunit-like protein
MSNSFRYSFAVDGEWYENLTYGEYLANEKLVRAVNDFERARLFLGLKILVFRWDYLKSHKDVKERFEYLREDQKRNRLKYYAPNSQEQLDFLNEWGDSDIVALVAPNRVGKTTTGVVKALLSGILELDPEWPIFKEHGVAWRRFMGAERNLTFAFGSYEWSHIKTTVWPRVKDYVPADILGSYSPHYKGAKPGRARKDPSFDRLPQVELTNGTVLKFHAYSQSQSNYESSAYDGFMWDEQPQEALFNAVDERCRTVRGRQFFTLTPHKVVGRVDTGGGGWLQKFLTGTEKRGHKVKSFNTSLMDVPDWIYPESEKSKAFEKWVHEPERLRNVKMIREGRSRVLGEWHVTSGLVIEDWDKKVHVIDDFVVPDDWTRYRGLDHGTKNPTVCLWAAVSPPTKDMKSIVVIYREFYSVGRLIRENVHDIIRLSGNGVRELCRTLDRRSGVTMTYCEEVFTGERYAKTVLDSRSFSSAESGTGKPNGHVYRAAGLMCHPASAKHSEHWVPLLLDLFNVDYRKPHPFSEGVEGCSGIYVFRSCQNLIREIEGWVWDEYRTGNDYKNAKETPRKKDDHGCTALAYLCQIPMRWRGDLYSGDGRGEKTSGYAAGGDDVEDSGYREV